MRIERERTRRGADRGAPMIVRVAPCERGVGFRDLASGKVAAQRQIAIAIEEALDGVAERARRADASFAVERGGGNAHGIELWRDVA
ncbi:MAG: hypothetical protein ACM31C_01030, partial [Acidobacteriota bacterium]